MPPTEYLFLSGAIIVTGQPKILATNLTCSFLNLNRRRQSQLPKELEINLKEEILILLLPTTNFMFYLLVECIFRSSEG